MTTGTFIGGTTFNIAPGETVNVIGGVYDGGAMFNLAQGATVDLTGSDFVGYSGTLTGAGSGKVLLAGGGMVVGMGGLTLSFPAGMFEWTAGEIDSAAGEVANAGSLEVPGGTDLNISGSFANTGTLTVNAGATLSVGGDFTQAQSGVLNLQIAGTPASGQFGQIAAQGTVTLSGSLNAQLAAGFTPQPGEDFKVLTYTRASGNFATISVLSPDLGERIEPTSVDLVANPNDTVRSPLGATLAATEGAAFVGGVATFTGSDATGGAADFSAQIAWGDGATTAGTVTGTPDGYTVTGSHAYAEAAGTLPVIVFIQDSVGSRTTVTGTASVAEAPLTPQGATITAAYGTTFTGTVASFSDANPLSHPADFTATLDWGDGQTSAGTIAEGNGTYNVTGSHTYAHSGKFVIETTVADDGVATAINGSALVDSPQALYVTAVYQDVLGRAPDSGGLAYWTKLLDGGAVISSVAESIAHSDEYYANFVIKPDYLKLLGRAADDAGVKYWTSQIDAGLTDQQLEAGMVSSEEFFHAAGGTNSAWLDAVYKLLLGRAPDAAGLAYWPKQLSAGETLSTASEQIAGSAENNTQIISDDYFHYLGRAADSAGTDYWLAQFAAGKTNEDLIAGFTGSQEYYQQHTK